MQREGNIRSHTRGDGVKGVSIRLVAPELIECHEGSGSIGGSPAHSSTNRNVLVNMKRRGPVMANGLCECHRRLHNNVALIKGNLIERKVTLQGDAIGVSVLHGDRLPQLERLEHREKFVITGFVARTNPQDRVDFARSPRANGRHHARVVEC